MRMDRDDLADVVRRLDRLDRYNRQLHRIVCGMAIIVAVVPLLGMAATSRTLVAEEFVLRDERGARRASLRSTGDGPALTFYDSIGQRRTRLDSNRLRFDSGDGQDRVGLGFNEENGPLMSLVDGAGTERVHLQMRRDGTLFRFRDPSGKDRATMAIARSPSFSLYDGQGTLRTMLTVTRFGPGVTFYDKERKMRTDLGPGVLTFYDDAGARYGIPGPP